MKKLIKEKCENAIVDIKSSYLILQARSFGRQGWLLRNMENPDTFHNETIDAMIEVLKELKR